MGRSGLRAGRLGGRRRVVKYGATRAEASAKLREVLDKAAKNIPTVSNSPTMAEYLAEWLVHTKPRVRHSTWAGYETNVRRHMVPRIGKKSSRRFGTRRRLMIDALRADGHSRRVIEYVHATLRAALQHAMREELLSRNVAKLVQIDARATWPSTPR